MIARLAALTRDVDHILAPAALLAAMHALPLESTVIGQTARGTPLEAWRIGTGSRPVLLYGFPDPGEAVGGTVILAIARAVCAGQLADLDVTWHCLPVANPDDQPADGRRLAPVQKVAAQEIDWWTEAPRPEATALLRWAAQVQPALIFPLHDEFHDGVPRPAYFPVSHSLPVAVCDALRALFHTLGHPVSVDLHDPRMGAGFARMAALAGDDWPRSTFHALAAHGPVLIAEVSAGLPDAVLVQAQLGVILTALAHL